MGKKSPAPPPAPDYAGAAQQQGIANLEAARLTARLSNPNVITPLGTQRVSWGRPQFNKQAYDAAMAQWRARNPQAPTTAPTPAPAPGGVTGAAGVTPAAPVTQPPAQIGEQPIPPMAGADEDRMYKYARPTEDYGLGEEGAFGAGPAVRRAREDLTMPALGGGPGLGQVTLPNGTTVPASYFVGGTAPAGGYTGEVMPTPEMFTETVDLDTPTIIQELTPEAQATLAAQQRVERALAGLGETAIGKVGDIYGTTFTPQGLPQQQFQFGGYGQLPTLGDLGAMGQFQRGITAEGLPTTPDITAMGRAGANLQAQALDYGPRMGQFGAAGAGPTAPSEIAGANLGGLQGVSYGPQEGQYGFARGFVPTEQLQQGIDVSGLAQMPVSAGMTGQQAILSRLTPQLQQERAQLETQLRNQGLVPGGEAYNREIELFNQRANDLTQQAALQGISLDAQMRAQGFSERQIQAEMANQARQAQFGMGVQQAGLYNQALAQNLAQGMGLTEARNRAQAQDFQQRLAAGQFGREAQQMAFQMGQSAQQMYNQAVQQNMAMGLSAAEAQNRAAQQAFQQQASIQELQNQALAQNQAAAMQQYQAQLGRQAQGFGQQMDVAGLYNAALAAQQQQALQQAQAQAALQAQGFNQAQAAAAFQNAQRQAALQEQLALRSQPLNEIAAIMGGAQVQMPQFQAYQGAEVAAAPIFGATQAAGNFAQQNYANQIARQNAQMGLYGSLAGMAGTALGGSFGGALGKSLFGS